MLNEHDQRLLKLLATDFRIKYFEDKGWCILKNNKIEVNKSFNSFDNAVDFIFDNLLTKE